MYPACSCHRGWGRYTRGPPTALLSPPGEPSPNTLCSSSSEHFSPKIVLHTFHLDADGSRSHFKRLGCMALWQNLDVEWKCEESIYYRRIACFVQKGGSVHPSFVAQSRQSWSVAWMTAGVRSLLFFFFICFCPFLLPTQDTLWQRGCKKQPGLAASLPQFYIPGLLFLKQFMPWSMDRLFRITEGTFPVRENFSSVLTWSLFSLLPQGARPTARAHLAIQGRCCCPGLELRH